MRKMVALSHSGKRTTDARKNASMRAIGNEVFGRKSSQFQQKSLGERGGMGDKGTQDY